MPMILLGIFVGAGFFAATFWSLFQAVRSRRRTLRLSHVAAAALSMLTMAALGLTQPGVSIVAGALLVGAAALAAVLERGLARFFPLSQIAVGAAVAAGLPFAA